MEYHARLVEAANFIKTHLGTADVAVVLGSGLNNFTDELSDKKVRGGSRGADIGFLQVLQYSEIPHIPQTSVVGHAGQLVLGKIGDRDVLCLAGRVHGYEGKQMFELTFFSRVLALLGVKLLVATNASGGAMQGMYNGCLMIIKDHINLYRRNPLAGISGIPIELIGCCRYLSSSRTVQSIPRHESDI